MIKLLRIGKTLNHTMWILTLSRQLLWCIKTLITLASFSGEINDKERWYCTRRSGGRRVGSVGRLCDGWRIDPEHSLCDEKYYQTPIHTTRLWEIFLVTLCTWLETKIGSNSSLGPKGFDCDLYLLLHRHSGVTLARILSKVPGYTDMTRCYTS